MNIITKKELDKILKKHSLWLAGRSKGERADLRGADLSGANLYRADLSGANLNNCIGLPGLACPEKGSFIGFKKASGFIIELEILNDAKRSSATTEKCRCSKARVISFTNCDGSALPDIGQIHSNYDNDFVYRLGEIVEVDNFDDNRWNECAPGIHFFVTRRKAVEY